MDDIDTAIAYLSLVVAFGAAVIAYLQKKAAESARDHAGRSADAAEKQTVIATDALTEAKAAAKAAQESAAAASRGIELEEESRDQARKADIQMLCWSGSNGLELENFGPGVASEVLAFRYDNREIHRKHRTVGPGKVNMRSDWEAPDVGEWPAGDCSLEQTPSQFRMRLTWTDPSGAHRDTGWVYVPKVG